MATDKYEKEKAFNSKIMNYMRKSPTSFHVIENNIKALEENGFQEIKESEAWDLEPGGKYYMTRNKSAIVSVKIPDTDKFNGFMIACSHSDHPCFKIINNCEFNVDNHYKILTVEPYPSTLHYTWFDSPLSVAGRLVVKSKDGISTRLVNVDRPLLMIPSLALHMQREINANGVAFDVEKEMRPIFSTNKDITLLDVVYRENNIDPKDVIDSELFVYRQDEPVIWGANNEFMSSRAIDDQVCVYCSLEAFLEADLNESIAMHVVFDNEEIGSWTIQGADSTLLPYFLNRIINDLKMERKDYRAMLPNSFILSCDNVHALHPNFPEKYNKIAKAYLGKGAVLKKAASYAYSTNAVSSSLLHRIADKEGARLQDYYNRPGDTPGATLAKFLCPQTSIMGADVGLAQLAMHSGYETCSAYDALHLEKLIKSLFSSSLIMKADGDYIVK